MILLLRRGDGNPEVFWLFLAIVAVIFGVAYFYSKKRTKDLTEAAATVGFLPAEDVPIVCEMPIFSHHVDLSNIFVGSAQGYEATFFDLQVGQGKSSYSQTVAGFRREGLVMPPFQIHNTDLGDRIAKHFTHEIVTIDGDPNFAARYTVRSVNPEGCRQFLTPEVLAYFTQLPPGKWTFEGSGDSLILYRRGSTVAGSKILEFLNDAGSLAAGFLSLLRPTAVI